VAWVLNCQPHDLRILVSARLLKPLGVAPPNSVKYFATLDVLELIKDSIREYRLPNPLLAEPFFLGLLALRGAAEAFSVYLYLRDGVLLVWWWDLLFQSRHFLN
jgi:hypothetical protein